MSTAIPAEFPTRHSIPQLQPRVTPPGTPEELRNWYDTNCSLLEAVYDYLTGHQPLPKRSDQDPPETTEELKEREKREARREARRKALPGALAACEAAAQRVGDARHRLQVSQVLYRVHEKLIDLARRLLDHPPYPRYAEWKAADDARCRKTPGALVGLDHSWAALLAETDDIMLNRLKHDDIIEDMKVAILNPHPPAEPPTIWDHGDLKYSRDKRNPYIVTEEEDNLLQVFLDNPTAMTKCELENESGVTNVSRVLRRLVKSYDGQFADAIRMPGKKCAGGYLIHVKSR
jgi:hypothetical protein